MNRNQLLSNLCSATDSLLAYIDAIPDSLASKFPAMPGCDRDEIEADVAQAKGGIKRLSDATVSIDAMPLVCAIKIKVKHTSLAQFTDWLAGQYAIADSTGFLNAAYCSGSDRTDALYLYRGNPKDILPALPTGQSYVWMSLP